MKRKYIKKMKPIKAWAILEDSKQIIWGVCTEYLHYEIFRTRHDAIKATRGIGARLEIIPVLISPFPRKKK